MEKLTLPLQLIVKAAQRTLNELEVNDVHINLHNIFNAKQDLF